MMLGPLLFTFIVIFVELTIFYKNSYSKLHFTPQKKINFLLLIEVHFKVTLMTNLTHLQSNETQ